MGALEGKVAFITGAARGRGRSHAVALATEGADIIAVDICAPIDSMPYEMASPADLDETVRLVEEQGRRIVARHADVRRREELEAALTAGTESLGGLDIVLANAGISPSSLGPEHPDVWQDVLDVNLTGVFHTLSLTAPFLAAQGRGGAIVVTGSTAGVVGVPEASAGGQAYTASKHAVVGLMRAYANLYAAESVRVSVVHPTAVNTTMANNPAIHEVFNADPSAAAAWANPIPVPWIEPIDVSNAILWLVSDAGRYVTGAEIRVDAGFANRA